MLLTNMFRNNHHNLSKKEDENQKELADFLQNKTRPAANNITLAVDDEIIVHDKDGNKEEQTPKEVKDQEELEEIFEILTAQNHLVSLAVNSKTAKVDKNQPDEVETKKSDDDSEANVTASTTTKENHNKQSPKPKLTAWLRASLGTAAQILTEAQPSVNAAAPPQTPLKDVVEAEKKEHDIKEEEAKDGISLRGTSLRKVTTTTPSESTTKELELGKESTEVVPEEEKFEEVHHKKEGTVNEVVQNVAAAPDDLKKELGGDDDMDTNEKPSGNYSSLTKAEQAAADSISKGVEKASNAISKGAKTLFGGGDDNNKAVASKDLKSSKDAKLTTNLVAAAAILGAGIGAAVLGSGTVDLEPTMDEDLIKMMD